jgi:hypothetical protein
MSGIAIAFAVVGWALFGVTLLSVVCDWAGLGRWSGRGAVDHDRPSTTAGHPTGDHSPQIDGA